MSVMRWILGVSDMTSSRPHIAIMVRIALLVLACIPVACEMLHYSPHQDDLPSSASRVNQKNIARILATPPGDELRIAFVTDTQNHYDESLHFVQDVNARDDIDFVVNGGDITHYGVSQEYEWMHEIFSTLEVPYLAVIGNHDLLANGSDLYEAVYGERNFAFVYAGTKFVFLDTNSRDYGFPGDVPDLDWLRDELAPSSTVDRTIVIGHVPPDHIDFDSDLEQRFAGILEKNLYVPLALYGHNHKYAVQRPYGQVAHLVTDSVEARQYTLVSLSKDSVSYETVDF
jgi:3',5'-cyclic AMP phosphodiesterase CpdA